MAVDKRLVSVVGTAVAALLITFVPNWEGTVLYTYKDPVGIKTACDGHTGPELEMGETFTPEECKEMLSVDLTGTAVGVKECITEPLRDNELAAYVSFAFNVGVTSFCQSTAAKKLNAGDHAGACAELSRWTMAKGVVLPGLVRRRAAERHLCES